MMLPRSQREREKNQFKIITKSTEKNKINNAEIMVHMKVKCRIGVNIIIC